MCQILWLTTKACCINDAELCDGRKPDYFVEWTGMQLTKLVTGFQHPVNRTGSPQYNQTQL